MSKKNFPFLLPDDVCKYVGAVLWCDRKLNEGKTLTALDHQLYDDAFDKLKATVDAEFGAPHYRSYLQTYCALPSGQNPFAQMFSLSSFSKTPSAAHDKDLHDIYASKVILVLRAHMPYICTGMSPSDYISTENGY